LLLKGKGTLVALGRKPIQKSSDWPFICDRFWQFKQDQT
jgi:hypothetical protein